MGDVLSDRSGSEHLVHPLLQTARGYLTDEDYVAAEATLSEAVERAKDLELLVFWCPDAEACKTCPCAAEDDVCMPGEALRNEACRLRAENERLRKALTEIRDACDEPDPIFTSAAAALSAGSFDERKAP